MPTQRLHAPRILVLPIGTALLDIPDDETILGRGGHPQGAQPNFDFDQFNVREPAYRVVTFG